MKIRCRTFNIYFLGIALAAPAVGAGAGDARPEAKPTPAPSTAQTGAAKDAKDAKEKKKKKKKELSTIRVHLEMQKDGSDRAVEVEVLRSNPVRVTIDKEPFLWEMYLGEARVIPTDGGGVEMEVTFNSHGRTLLENYTAANKGRRMVIAAEFDKQRRILAAPRITKLLSNGVIRFTPDASPEEAERIVNGWNNIAEVKRKKDKF